MDLVVRIIRDGIVAAILVLVALPPNNTARAQQAASAPPSQSEPATSGPPLLDPNLFKLPQTAPNFELDKLDLEKFRKATPEIAPPDRIDLGKYMLRLDTSRNVVDFVPRALNDAPELSDVIMPTRTGKKHKQMQNYFGLTLTTPMQ